MTLALPETLSPSKMDAFAKCPLAFRYEVIDKEWAPPMPAAERGTLVHATLERLMLLPPAERTIPNAEAILSFCHAELIETETYAEMALEPHERVEFYGEALNAVRTYFTLEDPALVDWVGLEVMLATDDVIDGTRLRGILDRLDFTPEGLVVVDYKGLALDTRLPTPTGWTTMGEVQVGDEVLGSDGAPTKVTGKSEVHDRACYKVTIAGGGEIVCDDQHLWNVRELAYPKYPVKTMNVVELRDRLEALKAEGRTKSLVIDNAGPLDLPEADLPIDPWLLGVWLGDGTAKSGHVTIGDQDYPELKDRIAERWPNVTEQKVYQREGHLPVHTVGLVAPRPDLCPRGHVPDIYESGGRERRRCFICEHGGQDDKRWNVGFQTRLRALGVLSNKHIPPMYLRASKAQRVELLRGLMDTDGYWNATRHRAVLVTADEALAHQIVELVDSLGITAQLDAVMNHKINYPSWAISLSPVNLIPFHLSRRADPAAEWVASRRPTSQHPSERRVVLSVEPTDRVPTQCIAVDALDSIYLCGDRMVPTHNSGKSPRPGYERQRLTGVLFYAMLIRRNFGVLPARVELLYLADGKRISYEPDDREVDAFERKAKAIWGAVGRAVRDENFQPHPSKLCPWCPWQSRCPAWRDQ